MKSYSGPNLSGWARRVLVMVLFTVGTAQGAEKKINVVRTPDHGIQPQAVVDAAGTLHLIYFKGEPGKGDLFYVHRKRGKHGFSGPIRVNSDASSAIATGTIRGGQIAIGKNQRVHVAWNDSKGKGMFYARLKEDGSAF